MKIENNQKPLPDLPIDKLQVRDDEYFSEDFLMIMFSLFESKGFTGFNQLQAVVDDPQVVLKIVRLMHGMQFKIPSLTEFSNIMKIAVYIYATLAKDEKMIDPETHKVVSSLNKYLGYTPEDQRKYSGEVIKWKDFLLSHGYDIRTFIPKLITKGFKKSESGISNFYTKGKYPNYKPSGKKRGIK